MKKYAVLTREPRCFLGSFDFSWEQRKLGDVVQITMGQSPDGSTYSDEPSDYILVQGNADLQNGWVCPRIWTTQITKKADAGDLIMSVRAPAGAMGKTAYNAVIGRGVAAIKGNEFIYQLLVKMDADGFWKTLSCGSTFESLNSDNIKNAEVKIPTTAEQIKIGGYFQQLDNLITLHQRKCVFLLGFFQALISMIFTASTFSWEQRKFSEITFLSGEKNRENLPLESYSITNESGFVPQDEKFENGGTMREADKRMYYIVSPNSFAYNPARINVGSIGYQNTGKNVIVSSLYEIFKTSDDVDDRLLWHWFKSPDFQKLIWQLQEGGVRLYFYYDKLCMGEVSLPSLEEQRKIGKFFDTLDNLITLHQRECISFTARAGRLILTANKKRNTSSWEQRKVSDLAEKTYGGGTPTTSNEAYWNGDIPWIQSSDVVDGKLLGVEPRKWITQDGLNNSAAQLIPGNSIAIITRVGVGKLAFMPYSYATSQDFLSLSKLNAEPLFTVYACYKKLQSELNAVQGTSIKGITKDELLAKNIMVPRYAEQQQIGAFFKQLDNLITLHQRKPFLMKWRTSDANRNQTNRLVL